MVTIIDFKERNKDDGSSFFVLEVQGGIELVQSQKTKQFYATAKKSYIPSTFNEITCAALVGTQMPGEIEKVDCDPYEYTVQETGEVITLTHRYQYVQEQKPKQDNTPGWLNGNPDVFSKNGKSEMAYA